MRKDIYLISWHGGFWFILTARANNKQIWDSVFRLQHMEKEMVLRFCPLVAPILTAKEIPSFPVVEAVI